MNMTEEKNKLNEVEIEFLLHTLSNMYDLDLNYSSMDTVLSYDIKDLRKYPFRYEPERTASLLALGIYEKLKNVLTT